MIVSYMQFYIIYDRITLKVYGIVFPGFCLEYKIFEMLDHDLTVLLYPIVMILSQYMCACCTCTRICFQLFCVLRSTHAVYSRL